MAERVGLVTPARHLERGRRAQRGRPSRYTLWQFVTVMVSAMALGLLAAPAVAAEDRQPNWPMYLDYMRPKESSGNTKAPGPIFGELRPTVTADPLKKAYGGVWGGAMCRRWTTDLKIGVENITDEGATVTYSAGNDNFSNSTYLEVFSADFSETVDYLVGRLGRGDYIFLDLRSDQLMKFKFGHHAGGHSCWGVLERIKFPPDIEPTKILPKQNDPAPHTIPVVKSFSLDHWSDVRVCEMALMLGRRNDQGWMPENTRLTGQEKFVREAMKRGLSPDDCEK